MTEPSNPAPSPDAPDAPETAAQAPRPRRRPGRRVVIGAVVLAAVVVAGVAAALLIPRGGPGDFRGGSRDSGPGIGLMGERGGHDGPGGWASGGWGPGGRGERGPGGVGDGAFVVGSVVSTGNGSLVVTTDGGAQRTLRTDDRTEVRGGGNQALGDLQPGERVVIRVEGSGDTATALSIQTPQARTTGTVTVLAGDTATITGVDGLTVTANIAALSQKPVVGDLVVITGTAANGTTITADGIRILPKAS